MALSSLFELEPDTKEAFKLEDTTKTSDYATTVKILRQVGAMPHAVSIIAFINAALSIVGPPEALYSMLADVGRRHSGYGVMAHYIPLMGQAFVHALKQVLGTKQWSFQLEDAWEAIFDLMSCRIVKGMVS